MNLKGLIPTIHVSHLFDFYSKRHYEFQMGWGIVGQTFTLFTFETFAMVFCDKFGITGYPAIALYLVAPVVAFLGITYMGHKMIQSGYANKYQQYASNVNEEWTDLVDNVSCIRKTLDEQDKRG